MLSLLPPPPSSPFDPPTTLYTLLHNPLSLPLTYLRQFLLLLRGAPYPPPPHPIRLILISDTHTQTLPVPPGDIIIHAGDLSNSGTCASIQAQLDWLSSLPHTHKVVIAGNHDSYLDPRSRSPSDKGATLDWGEIHYLQHSHVALKFPDHGARVLNVYGAPHIPRCGGKNFAFQYRRGEDAWSGTVPDDTDVLVTHTPPRWHLDLPRGMGCEWLLQEVWRVRPKVHVFGHVHAGRGKEGVFWDEGQRAWERLRERQTRPVLWGGSLGAGWWVDLVKVVGHGVLGVLWGRVWGAEGEGAVMVNAAVVDWKTGKVGYAAQVVDV